MNVPGLIVIVTLCCLDGLVIFAVYADCDLTVQGKITSNDQVKIPHQSFEIKTYSTGDEFLIQIISIVDTSIFRD